VDETYAHEGGPEGRSRYGGHQHRRRCLTLAKADVGLSSLTRNGPCRWKASAVRKIVTRHGGAVELVLAFLAQEGPREGVTLI
jgi:hypothetical protein